MTRSAFAFFTLEKKIAKTLALTSLPSMVISNSYNKSNCLSNLPLTIGLFIKYLIDSY